MVKLKGLQGPPPDHYQGDDGRRDLARMQMDNDFGPVAQLGLFNNRKAVAIQGLKTFRPITPA